MSDPGHTRSDCRILLLFPNWLGDAVMATGLLELLAAHRDLPDGRRLHVTLGIRQAWADLFRTDPRRDDLLILQRTGRHAGPSGLFRLRRDLAAGRFDAVLLGPPSLRVALAAGLAGIPLRVGYTGDGRHFLLNPGLTAQPRGRRHYFLEMLDLGRVLLDSLGLELSESDYPRFTSLPGCLAMVPVERGSGCPLWVLAPGSTYGQAKTWPLEQAREFCRLAVRDKGVELVLLGDAAAGEFAAALSADAGIPVAGSLAGQPGLVDMTGNTTLAEVVSLLRSARVFVGNDSGLMHLAAALGVPTLGIFGSSNPDWTSPVGSRTRTLAPSGFSCRPCYRKTCNQPQFCLETIGPELVLAQVEELLAAGEAPVEAE